MTPASPTAPGKPELRRQMRRALGALTPAERAAKSAAILQRLFARDEFKAARTIMAYASFGTEVETREVLRRCIENKQRLLLPRIDVSDNSMRAHVVADVSRDLAAHALGFLEPRCDAPQAAADEIDLIIVPGLAFTAQGVRLGRGQGYYDRFLASTSALRIGLAFDIQILPEIFFEAHDQPVNAVLTESAVY